MDLMSRKVSRYALDAISHGREEHREYFQMTVPDDFSQQEGWAGLKTVGMAIRTHKDKNGKSKTETRNGKKFAGYVRSHWGIEL